MEKQFNNPDEGSSVTLEAGVDEAGRGCLAGPVCVAAVILPWELDTPDNIVIRDSKKMTVKQRDKSATWIRKNAICCVHKFVDVNTIDRINILQATLWGMSGAISQLEPQPEFILIDGPHYTPAKDIPHKCVPQGDALYRNIAAASIIAKTERDKHMGELHLQYPQYGWDRNKAYGTLEHRIAIQKHGLTPHHRQTFKHRI